MSPVNFRKRPCRPVEFKGQEPPDGRPTLLAGDIFIRPVPAVGGNFLFFMIIIFFNSFVISPVFLVLCEG